MFTLEEARNILTDNWSFEKYSLSDFDTNYNNDPFIIPDPSFSRILIAVGENFDKRDWMVLLHKSGTQGNNDLSKTSFDENGK